MATRGRKPTPTAIKELEGNPGKRPLNQNEPKPKKTAPSCPKWLDKEAKKEWRRLAAKMEQMGVLSEVDMAAFAGYSRYGSLCRLLPVLRQMEGKRGVHLEKRFSCENAVRILAAGAAGIYRAAVHEADGEVRGTVRPDTGIQIQTDRGRRERRREG